MTMVSSEAYQPASYRWNHSENIQAPSLQSALTSDLELEPRVQQKHSSWKLCGTVPASPWQWQWAILHLQGSWLAPPPAGAVIVSANNYCKC